MIHRHEFIKQERLIEEFWGEIYETLLGFFSRRD